MTPQDEHDPNNPAHALYCNPCYNRMPGIGVRPHMQSKDEIVEQDFTGSISGFDFPPQMDIEEGDTAFDSSILASTLDFAGAPRPKWSPEDGDDDREEENIRRRERDEV